MGGRVTGLRLPQHGNLLSGELECCTHRGHSCRSCRALPSMCKWDGLFPGFTVKLCKPGFALHLCSYSLCSDSSRLIVRNADAGSLPGVLRDLTMLSFLDLSGNALTGILPAAYGSMPYLALLDLSQNQLSGTGKQMLRIELKICSGKTLEL